MEKGSSRQAGLLTGHTQRLDVQMHTERSKQLQLREQLCVSSRKTSWAVRKWANRGSSMTESKGLKPKQILNSGHFFPSCFSKNHLILLNLQGYVNSDPHLFLSQHLFTDVMVFLLHWNTFKRKGWKAGLVRGKSNWGNLRVWAKLSTGADYTRSRWPAHIWVIEKRCVEWRVRVRTQKLSRSVTHLSDTWM